MVGNDEMHHSSMYSVRKWIPSIIETLRRHQGEFTTLTVFCAAWQEESPGAPQSDRPGSFYATEESLEDTGKIIFRDGAYYLNEQLAIVPFEEMVTKETIINEEITLVINSCIENQKSVLKINESIQTRKENIQEIQDKIDRLKSELEIEKTNLSEDERKMNICSQEAEKNEAQLIVMIKDYLKEQANKK